MPRKNDTLHRSSSKYQHVTDKGRTTTSGALGLAVDVGQGTIIRLTDIQEPSGQAARRGGNLSIEYQFIERGRATRFQIRKRLQRLIVALLTRVIMKTSKETKWKRKFDRDQRWMDQNLKLQADNITKTDGKIQSN